jgi:membrane fusion protein (multidrug efflux system)
MSPNRPSRTVAALGVALAAALPACKRDDPSAARTRPAPSVTVAAVGVRDVPVEIRAPIDLKPLAQADAGAKTIGYLDAVLVERGDRVKRGQTLALVRPADLPDQLLASRGALAQAQAAAALARANKERAERLAPGGVVSQQELQQAQTGLATAEATLASATANVDALGTRLGELRIESPLDGVVSARRLDPGALVGPSSGNGAVVTVQRIDVLRVFVPVNERDVARLAVGQEARLELDALPGQPVSGKVVRVAPSFDPVSRTVDAEVQVTNADGALRPGMYGRAAIVTEVHRGAVVVPASALQISNGKAYAFTVQGEKAARVALKLGVDGGDWLEVVEGLKPGDEIVTAGADVLSDGAAIRPQRGVDVYAGRPAGPAAAPAKP